MASGSAGPGPAATEDEIRHKVTAADTLLGVSLMYNVSKAELKARNGLWTDEIWTRNEVVIPRKSVPAGFQPMAEEVVQSAAASQLSTALERITGNAGVARGLLEAAKGDFNSAVAMFELVRGAAAELEIEPKDVMIYVRMYDGDVPRALKELRQDVEWEKGPAGRQAVAAREARQSDKKDR